MLHRPPELNHLYAGSVGPAIRKALVSGDKRAGTAAGGPYSLGDYNPGANCRSGCLASWAASRIYYYQKHPPSASYVGTYDPTTVSVGGLVSSTPRSSIERESLPDSIAEGQSTVTVDVTTWGRATVATEVVQLYLRDEAARLTRPVKEAARIWMGSTRQTKGPWSSSDPNELFVLNRRYAKEGRARALQDYGWRQFRRSNRRDANVLKKK